jgi:hypothetical protein
MKKIIISVITMALVSCGPSRKDYSPRESIKEDKVISESRETHGNQNVQAGQITAGEFNDLAHWEFWQQLNRKSEARAMSRYWNYQLEDRIAVAIKNGSEALVDVPVQLLDENNDVLWETRTNNKGQAELWPEIINNAQSSANQLKNYEAIGVNEINIREQIQSNTNQKIDIAFMVDATGSMGDEIDYLKAELSDVIDHVKSERSNIDINTGAVFYRDHGDDYVTKVSDFSSNKQHTLEFINEQSADGGGDFPEAVDEALEKSIAALDWSDDATARLLFLVLDAPPHYDQHAIESIHHSIKLASKKGIHIIPITASGIDKETEFLMRYMAIATNGTYVFITNDSGIGNDHIEASVGPYQVEYLNDLMERLIKEAVK